MTAAQKRIMIDDPLGQTARLTPGADYRFPGAIVKRQTIPVLVPVIIVALIAATALAVREPAGVDAQGGPAALAPVEKGDITRVGVTIPPLLIYFVFFRTGIFIERLVRLPAVPAALARPAGALLLLGWAVLFAGSFKHFRAAGTSIRTAGPATALVVTGPYQLTRNPIQLGLLLAYSGIALWFDYVWPLILIPILVLTIRRLVIDREERYLERTFGDQYRRYQAAVRRWL